MKEVFTLLAAVLMTVAISAQTPDKMGYQAIIRNTEGNLVTEQEIGIQISILQGSADGTLVYTETQTPSTNKNGLISIEIGGEAGFADIDWANGPYFIKTETDPSGGIDYTITGTSQLLSVPYALHSGTSNVLAGEITESQITDLQDYLTEETDPLFNSSPASGIEVDDIDNWDDAYLWGDHAGEGYITDYTVTEEDVTVHQAALEITESQISDLGNYIETETDPSVPTGTTIGEMQYWDGSEWITVAPGIEGQVLTFNKGVPTWITGVGKKDVYNPFTEKIWMGRNLGATQVATSSADTASYGHLYQWGRASDGHEIRTSGTTSTLSSSDITGHGDFILAPDLPRDWRSPQNNNLWQGVYGINNPCPTGYRLPTEAELNAERLSWSSNNAAGALASPLKFPLAGYRIGGNGLLNDAGSIGYYWSSTIDGTFSRILQLYSNDATMISYYRAFGLSVRCLKDSDPPASFNLNLEINPSGSGIVTGAGQYEVGVQVKISATANPDWVFVNWSGDTDYLDYPTWANATITGPAYDISLTANFEEGDFIYGDGVTDIDGNEYITVIIGNQEWMAENLRVTKYNNGDAIPTGLSNTEWVNTTYGAYSIFPHDNVSGINSAEEMVTDYGALYNWFAVDDDRGLCPIGWNVLSDAEWSELVNYLVAHGYPNESNNPNSAGNALKSCSQMDSPLGNNCNTAVHPRWDSHETHHGFDEFGFSALPGGYRRHDDGTFENIGYGGFWWSSTEGAFRRIRHNYGTVGRGTSGIKELGFSVRCVRNVD